MWLLYAQLVAGYTAPESEEYLEAGFVRGEAVSYGDSAFVLNVGMNISSGEDGRVVPEGYQAFHGGAGWFGSGGSSCGFRPCLKHALHDQIDGLLVMWLTHVFQTGNVEGVQKFPEYVFRLPILNQTFHADNPKESVGLAFCELAHGLEEGRLLP